MFREHEYDSPYIPAPQRVLARDNIHFKERLHIFLPLIEGWQKYGPACIGLEVQAAIVGYYQQANRYNTASEAKSLYHRKKVELRDGLKGLPKCYVSFKQFHEDGSPVYTEDAGKELNKRWRATTRYQKPIKSPDATKNDANGSIRSESSKTVPDFLRKTRKLLRLDERFSQRERSFPCQQDGQLSLNPTHWSEILPPSGPLRCWADYHAASQAEHFTSTQSTKLSHESFPYLKSPVAEYADREKLPLLVPTPGCQFLVLRVRDLLCYLRTHNEHDFIHEAGLWSCGELVRLVGDVDEAAFATSSEWYSGDFTEALPTLTDGEYEKLPYRRQPAARWSRFGWDAEPFYTTYRFFERPQSDRDCFLVAIFDFDRTGIQWQTYYLAEERREELFHAIVRRSIKGLIHGWSGQVVTDQLQKEYGDAIPKSVGCFWFFQTIEHYHRFLLDGFRFRGQINSFLDATLLPKLCIDPVERFDYQPTNYWLPEICLDGEWKKDFARNKVSIDPMARDAFGDIDDYKIIRGENVGGQGRGRWNGFLTPLLEERGHDLGVSEVVPGKELADRLYLTSAISRNGKPGRPIYEVEKPYTCWMETLDDLKKAVAYALIRTGATLVAVSTDSFVLEIEENTLPETIQAITNTAKQACESILDLKQNVWGNFVEAEHHDAWPKPSFL